MLSFENDYSEGAHEKILQRFMETNLEKVSGYGSDPYCESAKQKIREACECPQADVYFLTGGTQTNAVVISSMLESYEGVVAAQTGHVACHEAGAIEYSGHKVITVPQYKGKMKAEDLKNCLTFLDKMNDDPMLELADYGIEGISYDLNENGNVVLNPDYDASQTPNCGLNQAVAYIPNMSSVSHPLEKAESQIESEACQEVNEKYAVFNPALGYLANSATNAEVGTDIEQIIDDARTQYICGQIDDAGLDDAAQQWLDRGGAQLVEEVNELYAADTNK